MICPYCKAEDQPGKRVVFVATTSDFGQVKIRQRYCKQCGKYWLSRSGLINSDRGVRGDLAPDAVATRRRNTGSLSSRPNAADGPKHPKPDRTGL